MKNNPDQAPAAPETVILVHGLWMTGIDMALLRARLRRCGFNVVQFSYPTTRNSIAANAVRLYEFAGGLDASVVHFVGHSLGGLVIMQLFQDFPQQRPGRIVLLGTPYTGSHAARRMAKYALGKWLLGRSLDDCLYDGGPLWASQRELGVLAGTLALGGGLLVTGLKRPHDGTVALAETQVPGHSAQLSLPVSHMGMLVSKTVAREVCGFLRNGRFSTG